jgi:hypothetical protein
MAAEKIRNDEIFQPLTETEVKAALEFAISNAVSIVGKCDDGTVIVVKPRSEGSSPTLLSGLLKSSSRIHSPQEAIFSFVVNETKFLFKSVFNVLHGKTVTIGPLNTFYFIQRRNNERLKIPTDYYAVFKFTHLNGRPLRSFGKLKDISIGGAAIIFRNAEPKINAGDSVRGVLTLSCRPPEDLELKIKHVRSEKDGETPLQIFGATFLPEESNNLKRRMNSVITDIYRDIFKNLDPKKN